MAFQARRWLFLARRKTAHFWSHAVLGWFYLPFSAQEVPTVSQSQPRWIGAHRTSSSSSNRSAAPGRSFKVFHTWRWCKFPIDSVEEGVTSHFNWDIDQFEFYFNLLKKNHFILKFATGTQNGCCCSNRIWIWPVIKLVRPEQHPFFFLPAVKSFSVMRCGRAYILQLHRYSSWRCLP